MQDDIGKPRHEPLFTSSPLRGSNRPFSLMKQKTSKRFYYFEHEEGIKKMERIEEQGSERMKRWKG